MNSPTRNLNKNSSSGSLKGSADGYAGKGIMHSSSIKRLADLDNEDHYDNHAVTVIMMHQ